MPRVEVPASAIVEPNHTAIGAAVLLKATTANCVLSPNSATVMRKKVVKNKWLPFFSGRGSSSSSALILKDCIPKIENFFDKVKKEFVSLSWFDGIICCF